jgi:hypothetical protein
MEGVDGDDDDDDDDGFHSLFAFLSFFFVCAFPFAHFGPLSCPPAEGGSDQVVRITTAKACLHTLTLTLKT